MSMCHNNRYIEYCRGHIKPRLSDAAAKMLQNNYVRIRQVLSFVCGSFFWMGNMSFPKKILSIGFWLWNHRYYVWNFQQMRQQAHESGDSPAIPITVRQLEAIIRLSESIAKMQLWVVLALFCNFSMYALLLIKVRFPSSDCIWKIENIVFNAGQL